MNRSYAHSDPRFEGILRGLKIGKTAVLELEDMVSATQKSLLSRLCDRDADTVEALFKEYVFTTHSFALPAAKFYEMLLGRLEQERQSRDFQFIKKQSKANSRQSRRSLNSSCTYISLDYDSIVPPQPVHVRRSSAVPAKPVEKLGYSQLNDKRKQLSSSLAKQDSRTAAQLMQGPSRQSSNPYALGSSMRSTRPVTPDSSVLLQDFTGLRRDFKKAYPNPTELLKVRRLQLESTKQ